MTNPQSISEAKILEGLLEGKEIAQIRGLNPKSLDFIYAAAGFHYASGNFKLAAKILNFLCLHKHHDPDMWLAYARAEMAAGEPAQARKAYLIAFQQRPTAPLSVEMARAYLAAGAKTQTRHFLAAARQLAEQASTMLEVSHDIDMLETHLATLQ